MESAQGYQQPRWVARHVVGGLRLALAAAASAMVLVAAQGVPNGPNGQVPPAAPELRAAPVGGIAPNPDHPFSAPIWSPVRAPAKIGCVKTNCGLASGEYFHGYWAIDFFGERGAPIHPAGAGVFHIGATAATCSTSSKPSPGTWGWVDHGGGVATKYHHLDSITAKEGQLVTPATVIGRMGHWGDAAPCTSDYLHFEVREGGITGPRVDPRTLRACTVWGVSTMPWIFDGALSFDDVARKRFATPEATSGCITASWNKTAAAPALSLASRSSAALLTWGTAPSGTNAVRVAYEVWIPSEGRYSATKYSTYSATRTSATLTGLKNGKTYRVRVAFRNTHGFSKWSTAKKVVPSS